MNASMLDVLILMSLILLNGGLAMAEIAIISSNPSKIAFLSKEHKNAKVVQDLMSNGTTLLSTIQIGITLIGLISGAFSGQRFAEPIGTWLNSIDMVGGYGYLIAFTAIVIIVTYISIIFGEIIPKRLAILHPEKIAMIVAIPIRSLSKLTLPLVLILDVTTKFFLKALGQDGVKESSLSEQEIQSVMQEGFEKGAIDAFEHKVFEKVLRFGDREASIMMTPRIKVVSLDLEDSLEENIEKILKNAHRYYPVFEGGIHHFKGIIDTKDIMRQLILTKKIDLKSALKEALFVIEDNLGPDLLEKFKKHQTHIAIVVDEYGVMQGLITLIDLFETLIDHLPEVQQNKHYEITQRDDGTWLCDGLTPIDDVENLLEKDVFNSVEDADFNTLAGFLLVHFNHIPKAGESIIWEEFKFEVVDMDGTRIDKVLIQKNPAKKSHLRA